MNRDNSMKISILLASIVAAISLPAAAQSVRSTADAFPIAPAAQRLPVAPLPVAPAAAKPVTQAPVARTYALEEKDRNLRAAFGRWARERGASMQWLLVDDVPIDAPGPVRNTYPDLDPQQFASSSYPDLVEAMTVVAHAFSKSRSPFVVREFDNTIVVQPRLSARK
jgi:hypothetical protein